MIATPETIEIFPSGDPRGMLTAEITTRIVQVIEVSRSPLPGRTSNGWKERKSKDGWTLHEVTRQDPEGGA